MILVSLQTLLPIADILGIVPLIRYIDVGPIFLTDWYHEDYFSIVENVMGTDISKVVSLARYATC